MEDSLDWDCGVDAACSQDSQNRDKTEVCDTAHQRKQPNKLGDTQIVNIPIQMIAASDRDGKLTPMYFRFETAEHVIEKVAIERTISRDECCYVGIREKRFVCSAIICKERRIMEIRYHVENQKWRIFQFLA